MTTAEAGRNGQSDPLQLEFAATNERAIVTANQRDFVPLHRDWILAGRSHAGIIVLTQQVTAVGAILVKLRETQDRTAEEMRDAILFLSAQPLQDSSS